MKNKQTLVVPSINAKQRKSIIIIYTSPFNHTHFIKHLNHVMIVYQVFNFFIFVSHAKV
jgi:hypothetical protein